MNGQADNQTIIEANNRRLEAWNEWKIICSIKGCSQKNSRELAQLVTRAFIRKLKRVTNFDFNLFEQSRKCAEAEGGEEMETKAEAIIRTCVHEFDTAIEEMSKCPGVNKHTGKERLIKKYKDNVWNKIRESGDEPLKVIHGNLLGPVSIMNDIVENFLYTDRGFVWESEDGMRILKPVLSVQDEIEGNDGTSAERGDMLEISSTMLLPSDVSFISSEIPKRFNAREAAVFLALDAKIPKTDEALLRFLGLEKTQAYDILKKTLNKLKEFLEENYSPELFSPVLSEIINCFFSMLETEKGASEFLSVLETKNGLKTKKH